MGSIERPPTFAVQLRAMIALIEAKAAGLWSRKHTA
jgi:hypothetical protein